MTKRSCLALLTWPSTLLLALAINSATWTNAVSQLPQSDNDLLRPAQAPADYWLIKSLGMRTLACLCANQYPVGLDAGEGTDFTFKIIKNQSNEEIAIHSLCIKKNKEQRKSVLGHITLPLVKGGELKIGTPGNDRLNPSAAVLREKQKGALLIPFKRQGYRLNKCPKKIEHYRALNWAQPQNWSAM